MMDQAPAYLAADFRFEVQPAGRFSRLVNFLVDMAVIPTLTVWGAGAVGRVWDLEGLSALAGSPALVLCAILANYLLGETVFQQSLGKMLTRTCVVTPDGRAPSFLAVLLRTVFRFLPLEFASILGRRMWHDSLSGTTVARLPLR